MTRHTTPWRHQCTHPSQPAQAWHLAPPDEAYIVWGTHHCQGASLRAQQVNERGCRGVRQVSEEVNRQCKEHSSIPDELCCAMETTAKHVGARAHACIHAAQAGMHECRDEAKAAGDCAQQQQQQQQRLVSCHTTATGPIRQRLCTAAAAAAAWSNLHP
eukprot:664711-Pelagomonas_calceolata.AAC.4